MEKKRLTLSSESLNRNGYRVKTSGIRLEGFLKNPVMFLGHMSWGIPVGKWEDVKIEGDKLTAVPVFNEATDLGTAMKKSFDGGFLFATSIGFKTLQTSTLPEDTLPGQQYATVTESELLEASFVGIPGNADATLASQHDFHFDGAIPKITKLSIMDFSKIAQALGLAANADEAAILAAIEGQLNQLRQLKMSQVDNLLALGERNGLVTADNKDAFRALAVADFANAQKILLAAPGVQQPSAAKPGTSLLGLMSSGTPAGKPTDERSNWTYEDWEQKDSVGLLTLKRTNESRYNELAAAMYAKTV